MKKIMIALINNRETLPTHFVSSLIGLLDYTRKFYEVKVQLVNANFICQMRNLAVEVAKQEKCTHLFMVDCDMIYPKETIVELMKHKKEIVGGMYFKRKVPHNPVHWKKINIQNIMQEENIEYFQENKLKKVEATAGGGLLIKLSALKKIEPPYFQVRYVNSTQCIGEDIDFCYKCHKKINIWIDPKIRYAHLHEIAVTGENEFKEIR